MYIQDVIIENKTGLHARRDFKHIQNVGVSRACFCDCHVIKKET